MNLKELMHSKGFTAQSLADASGVSRRTIEQHTREWCTLSNARAGIVLALAKALGVTVEELLNEPSE